MAEVCNTFLVSKYIGSCSKRQHRSEQGIFVVVMWIITQGANARLDSFVGATAVADLLKSTLGPKGMDKIIQNVLFENRCDV